MHIKTGVHVIDTTHPLRHTGLMLAHTQVGTRAWHSRTPKSACGLATVPTWAHAELASCARLSARPVRVRSFWIGWINLAPRLFLFSWADCSNFSTSIAMREHHACPHLSSSDEIGFCFISYESIYSRLVLNLSCLTIYSRCFSSSVNFF